MRMQAIEYQKTQLSDHINQFLSLKAHYQAMPEQTIYTVGQVFMNIPNVIYLI